MEYVTNCRWNHKGKCIYWMPDSMHNCNCRCKYYEENQKMNIDGVGKDAEVVVNDKGGKQSKAVAALHLIDPIFLQAWFAGDKVMWHILEFIKYQTHSDIESALLALQAIKNKGDDLNVHHENEILLDIGKVLQEGAEKYTPNNWRLIPQEEHINHALIHYIAYTMGDTQDNHLEHCMTRLMMAYATEKSPKFDYGAYVGK